MTGGLKFLSVHAGSEFTCGLATGGAAYCWGRNWVGELGTETRDRYSAVPVPVSGGLTFTALATGVGYACGITAGGAVCCWGGNAYGEAGFEPEAGARGVTAPRRLTSDSAFRAVSAGQGFTCALTTGGTAYCWGKNDSGQLGDGTTMNRSTPAPVAGCVMFQSISAGTDHVCGLATDAALYCWGLNENATLGVRTTSGRCRYEVGPGEYDYWQCITRPARVVDPR